MFCLQVLPRKPLEPLNFDDLPSSATTGKTNTLLQPPDAPATTENAEEKHSDLSLCEMSDQFPDLAEDSCFQIKKRIYAGRSYSAPTICQVRLHC